MIVATMFRDAEHHVARFMAQLDGLRNLVPVSLCCIEGDSIDRTWEALWDYGAMPLKVEHGGDRFGSVDHPQRWRQIAAVCDVLWASVCRQQAGRPVIYVESGLVWAPHTMIELVNGLERYPAVAAMSMHESKPDPFYDIWGHTKNGTRFQTDPPYHPDLGDSRYVEVDSAGSCFAVRADAVPAVWFSPLDGIRGVGRSLHAAGHNLWLDTQSYVYHP